jgi:ligand-binding SRPBCC domain-containing protein
VATIIRNHYIPYTPEQVWAVGGDFSRYPEWNATHAAFPDGAPELVAGNKFREQVTIMGLPGEVKWTITEVEHPSRFVLAGEGPMGITLGASLELTPEGEGTRGAMEASFTGGPLAGPLGDAVAKATEKVTDESLAKLEALVAAGAAAPVTG